MVFTIFFNDADGFGILGKGIVILADLVGLDIRFKKTSFCKF